MDQQRFHAVTRLMTTLPSRRHLLRGLAGAGLGLGIARLPDLVEARKSARSARRRTRQRRRCRSRTRLVVWRSATHAAA